MAAELTMPGPPLLFDALTHVTADGQWFDTRHDASLGRLLSCLKDAGPSFACVVGIDGYNMPDDYIHSVCESTPALVPIAGFTPGESTAAALGERLESIRARGFRGIKIHPTLCGVSLEDPALADTFAACDSLDLRIFLCTFCRRRGAVTHRAPIDAIYDLLASHPRVGVVLVHGGLSELMTYADMVRGTENAVLDLSWTLMKYAGSSLDLDLAYLFRNLDRRLVVGSDFPEFTPAQVRARVGELTEGLSAEKVANVMWRNLATFLKVETSKHIV